MELTDFDKIANRTRERNYRSLKRLVDLYILLRPVDHKIHWKP